MDKRYFEEFDDDFEENRIAEKEMEDRIWRSVTYPLSLSELLSQNTKESLCYVGEFYGIKINSTMKKADIVAQMSRELLTDMGNYILNMEPEQFALLVKVARNKKGYVLWEKISNKYELEHMEYFINYFMLVPVVIEGKRALTMLPEVKSIFIKKSPKGLGKILEKNYVRRRIIYGMLYFYGVIFFDDIIRVFEESIGEELTKVQLAKDIQEIVAYDQLISFDNGYIFDKSVSEDEIHTIFSEILKRKNIDYKIFSANEYYKASVSGSVILNESSEKLLNYFEDMFEDNEFSQETLGMVDYMFRTGMGIVEAFDFVQSILEKPLSKKKIENLIEQLNNVYNNTLQWSLKGHTPSELFDIKKPFLKQLPNNVVSFPSGARVGRNDPCPCGSGKKYKKCCLSKHQQEERVRQEIKELEVLSEHYFEVADYVAEAGYPLLNFDYFLFEILNVTGEVLLKLAELSREQTKELLKNLLIQGKSIFARCQQCECGCLKKQNQKVCFQVLKNKGLKLQNFPAPLRKQVGINFFYHEFLNGYIVALDKELNIFLPEDEAEEIIIDVHSALFVFVANNCWEGCNNKCLKEYTSSAYCKFCSYGDENKLPCPKNGEISYKKIHATKEDMIH